MSELRNDGIETSTPKKPNQRMELVLATPEILRVWRERNTKNFRSRSESNTSRILEDIRDVGFVHDGNPIKFRSDGTLADGQNRIEAMIRLEMTQWVWVCYGVDDDRTVDETDPRKLQDHLKRRRERCSTQLAATLRACVRYERRGSAGVVDGQRAPTIGQCLKFLDHHADVRESVLFANRYETCGSKSHISLIHYYAGARDEGLVESFFEGVKTGANLGRNDPRLRWRNVLEKELKAKTKYTARERLALLLKAWSYHAQARELTTLWWRSGGDKPEPFPELYLPPRGDSEPNDDRGDRR